MPRADDFAGEAGTVGSLSAGVNAIVDALSVYGIRRVEMPCTPYRKYAAELIGLGPDVVLASTAAAVAQLQQASLLGIATTDDHHLRRFDVLGHVRRSMRRIAVLGWQFAVVCRLT